MTMKSYNDASGEHPPWTYGPFAGSHLVRVSRLFVHSGVRVKSIVNIDTRLSCMPMLKPLELSVQRAPIHRSYTVIGTWISQNDGRDTLRVDPVRLDRVVLHDGLVDGIAGPLQRRANCSRRSVRAHCSLVARFVAHGILKVGPPHPPQGGYGLTRDNGRLDPSTTEEARTVT